jgi:hypothetical protein
MWKIPLLDPTVVLYMVCHGSHEYTPVMLAYIPAAWIRHGIAIGNSPMVTSEAGKSSNAWALTDSLEDSEGKRPEG